MSGAESQDEADFDAAHAGEAVSAEDLKAAMEGMTKSLLAGLGNATGALDSLSSAFGRVATAFERMATAQEKQADTLERELDYFNQRWREFNEAYRTKS
jgi:hypothetical protein